jgi:tRNA A37 methylthiotransferase MiaB
LVRRIQKKAPEAMVVITGCYAQLKPTEIAIEPEPLTPPPLVMVENKQITEKKNTENDYDIYNLETAANYV